MRIFILGICGTFMAGIAMLAKQNGHDVMGCDENVYPPMSTQLEANGIKLLTGYMPSHIPPDIDYVVVGNVIKRGNPAIEFVLENNIPYVSGPEWLAKNLLKDRWVLAVSGTHGKTTTTSLLAWILEVANKKPGFLIGGVPENFGVSARIGPDPFFVIEADEYDCAFFDKRAKFIHYHPKTLILNNLEFDHADIFPNLEAIKQQFHYLIRTVPGNGLIIRNQNDANLKDVLDKGCWTSIVSFGEGGEWQAKLKSEDGSKFSLYHNQQNYGEVDWDLIGKHNVENALAATAAAFHANIPIKTSIEALATFKNVKRRLEIKSCLYGITIYDDFAHHPTAIATTLAGLKAKVGRERIIAVLEFGSYTMRSGVHQHAIQAALKDAAIVYCKKSIDNSWDIQAVLKDSPQPFHVYDNVNNLIEALANNVQKNDHVVVMSNGAFDGIHQKIVDRLSLKYSRNAHASENTI